MCFLEYILLHKTILYKLGQKNSLILELKNNKTIFPLEIILSTIDTYSVKTFRVALDCALSTGLQACWLLRAANSALFLDVILPFSSRKKMNP